MQTLARVLRLGCIFFLLLASGHGAAPPPLPWRIPPLDGELEGDFKPGAAADGPVLHWKITARTPRPRARSIELALDGPGARVRLGATLDPAGEGTWELREAELDLGRWLPVVGALTGQSFAGVTLAGTLSASGAGPWRGGVAGGRAALTWRDGRVDDPAHKLTLEGVRGTVVVEDIATRRTAPGQVFTWTGGRYDVVAIGGGRAVWALDGDRLNIAEVTLAVFGGEVALSAMRVVLGSVEAEMTARITGIDAALVLPLFPQVVTSAQGRLDGTLSLRRDAEGVHLGAGRLALPRGGTADVKLKPSPGLLTQSLPDAVRQYYPGLADLEAGRVPLRADVLEVTFDPAGDAEGRTARVRLAGGPVDPRMRAPIDLTVNIRGPLDTLVKFGTNSRLHWGGGEGNKR
ncbi:MAG: YdbH domain-containing protein [Opitutaceae bacterium]|nr:YdbH domain-containing protein [Opitutaceae bacterium]